MVSKAETGGLLPPGIDTLPVSGNRDWAAPPSGDGLTRPATYNDDPTYDAVEIAVRETERGRWFLSEHARRQRLDDTNLLLGAIARLGSTMRAASAEATALQLEQIIHAGLARISARHPEFSADDPVQCVNHISVEARQLFADLKASLMAIINDPLNTPGDTPMPVSTLTRLHALKPRLEAMEKSGESIEDCLALLVQMSAHMRESVPGGRPAAMIPPLKAEQARYFTRDEDIFEPVDFGSSAPQPPPQTALEKASALWTGPAGASPINGPDVMPGAREDRATGEARARPRIVFSRTAVTNDLPLPDTNLAQSSGPEQINA